MNIRTAIKQIFTKRDNNDVISLRVSNEYLKYRLEETTKELELLKQELNISRPLIKVDFQNVEPIDKEKRRDYVGKIAIFHAEVMKPKIMAMIEDLRSQLEKLDSTKTANGETITGYSPEDFDKIIKGSINSMWLMYDWFELMTAEHKSYLRNEGTDTEVS
jgi:hypothetical protein